MKEPGFPFGCWLLTLMPRRYFARMPQDGAATQRLPAKMPCPDVAGRCRLPQPPASHTIPAEASLGYPPNFQWATGHCAEQ